MKTEIVNIPGKGVCILISDIEVKDFLKYGEEFTKIQYINGIYDPHTIAENIKINRRISAIKELRKQTNWNLREAKNYIDKYYDMFFTNWERGPGSEQLEKAANKFIQDHTPPEDFIKESEMTL